MQGGLEAVDPVTLIYIILQVGGEHECCSEDQLTELTGTDLILIEAQYQPHILISQ